MKRNIKIKMPENVEMILNKLSGHGYEAVIIGGCVRDSVMEYMPHDWDIATSAQPEEIMEIFKDFRLMTAGLKHGTVTVIISHEPYEITTYRVDGKYTDFRRPDTVNFTSDLAEDVLRRDFTINAIAYDGEKIIDLHNGIGDIEHGIIRCVGNPDDRFQEDPIRILRALRFAVKFKFQIEANTAAAMRRHMKLLDHIAIERKQSEFTKIICTDSINGNFEILKRYQDVLSYVMSDIADITKWNKTVDMVRDCDGLCEKLAILIDMAKVESYHNVVGILMRYPNKISKSVCNIMECRKELITDSVENARHLLSKYSKEDIIKTTNYKLAKIISDESADEAMMLCLYKAQDTIEEVYSNPEKYCYDLKHLDINGHDLKSIGVPDVEISHYLWELLQLVITGAVENNNEKLIQVAKISRF